jgi:hypothetical protein
MIFPRQKPRRDGEQQRDVRAATGFEGGPGVGHNGLYVEADALPGYGWARPVRLEPAIEEKVARRCCSSGCRKMPADGRASEYWT